MIVFRYRIYANLKNNNVIETDIYYTIEYIEKENKTYFKAN